mmetsp:Transcript_13486/g.30608  ORF Transcript_13486/g.30608 Transcript_13486/m.30608 type:complete len:194 (-) Transcript_13486:30-611(-)
MPSRLASILLPGVDGEAGGTCLSGCGGSRRRTVEAATFAGGQLPYKPSAVPEVLPILLPAHRGSAASSFLSTPLAEIADSSAIGSKHDAHVEHAVSSATTHGEAGQDWRLTQSSMQLHVESALRAARTGLMVTGGMCNKLFGLGMIGVLAFQSAKANVNEQPAPPRQPELVSQFASSEPSSPRSNCSADESTR